MGKKPRKGLLLHFLSMQLVVKSNQLSSESCQTKVVSREPTIHNATSNVQHVVLNFCMHHIATMLHVKLAVMF